MSSSPSSRCQCFLEHLQHDLADCAGAVKSAVEVLTVVSDKLKASDLACCSLMLLGHRLRQLEEQAVEEVDNLEKRAHYSQTGAEILP